VQARFRSLAFAALLRGFRAAPGERADENLPSPQVVQARFRSLAFAALLRGFRAATGERADENLPDT
jgi:hypothetical protein